MLDNLPESSFETPNNLYKDLLQPSVRETGEALKVIAKTFSTLLLPLKALNETAEIKYRNFINDFNQKASTIPNENIRVPDLSVIGPALMDLSFSLDEKEIRDLYMNLLLGSIDNRTNPSNLRSFTQIIKQLSPFEAKLLKKIYTCCQDGKSVPVARISVFAIPHVSSSGQRNPVTAFKNLLTNISIESSTEELIDLSLKNYLRLGLIEMAYDLLAIPYNEYSYVESTKVYKKASELLNTPSVNGDMYNKIEIERFSFFLSTLGESFCNICMG